MKGEEGCELGWILTDRRLNFGEEAAGYNSKMGNKAELDWGAAELGSHSHHPKLVMEVDNKGK